MIKKRIIFIFTILLLVVIPLTTLEVPEDYTHKEIAETATPIFTRAEASTVSKPVEVKKSTVVKKPAAKKTTKKKVSTKKRRERLIVAPAFITLDTAPHSPRPIARKKTTKKTTTKKKT